MLFVRKEKDCVLDQFYGGKEREEEGAENHFVQFTGEREEMRGIISQGRDRLLLPGPKSSLLRICACEREMRAGGEL